MIGRRQAMAGGLAATVAGCAAPSEPQAAAGLRGAPFAAFYHALDGLKAGLGPVNVLQIGDSHTANDAFSTRMRELMQGRFGDAGRGMLPPGIPFRTYNPAQIKVTAAGWQTVGGLDPSGPIGLAGVRMSAVGPAEMTWHADAPGRLARVAIEALGQPGGGGIEASWDGGRPTAFSTNARGGSLWCAVAPGREASTLTVRSRGDGPVDLLSTIVMRDRPGVTWSNLGTIGATVDLIGRWDAAILAAEMARLRPVLVAIAFGTNEGFKDATDIGSYEGVYAAQLQTVRRAAPDASILVMGPPDGVRRATADTPADQVCAKPSNGATERQQWTEPAHLAEVRAAQRRVASAAGAMFWDWSTPMGGPCGMQAWARTDPPKAQPDHVHLFTLGYRATADALFDDLMAGYARRQAIARR